MGVRFEITTEPGTVAPGDLVVLRLVTQKGGVKWTCGTVRCFTDDEDQPAIVLTTGKIPEYDGYGACVLHQVHPRRSANGTQRRWRGGGMNAAYKVLYALAVWPVALILAVIGAWWRWRWCWRAACSSGWAFPERVGVWLGGDRR